MSNNIIGTYLQRSTVVKKLRTELTTYIEAHVRVLDL